MVQQRGVNDQQRAVLDWIVEGCPDGVMTGHTHKTTAAALQTRGLVEVSRRGGGWSATPTAAGRHFAAHGTYPAGPVTAETNTSRASERTAPRTASATTVLREPQPGEPTQAEALTFLDILAQGDGTLTVKMDDTHTRALVKAAHRLNLVPDDRLLTTEAGRWGGPTVVHYKTKPAWMTVVLEPHPGRRGTA